MDPICKQKICTVVRYLRYSTCTTRLLLLGQRYPYIELVTLILIYRYHTYVQKELRADGGGEDEAVDLDAAAAGGGEGRGDGA